jgi:hypothetical protein
VTDAGHLCGTVSPERWERLRSDLQVEAEADHFRLGGLHCTANSHKALLLAEAAK